MAWIPDMFLGGGLKYLFIFNPDPWGNDSQFDEHIFQKGLKNHQLVFHPICLDDIWR